MASPPPLTVGFLLFPRLTQLDLTGPYEAFSRAPGVRILLIGKTLEEVLSDSGLALRPDTPLHICPPLDVVCVPGGPGVSALAEDEEILMFLRTQARTARYVTSVCTGSLVLGAAGLLRGKRATCHWASHHLLAPLGAIPVKERVVRDGALITGGGITAGIDFALVVLAELCGEAAAQAVQLQMEYAPAPPFRAGSEAEAPAEVVAAVRGRMAHMLAEREKVIDRVSARLRSAPV